MAHKEKPFSSELSLEELQGFTQNLCCESGITPNMIRKSSALLRQLSYQIQTTGRARATALDLIMTSAIILNSAFLAYYPVTFGLASAGVVNQAQVDFLGQIAVASFCAAVPFNIAGRVQQFSQIETPLRISTNLAPAMAQQMRRVANFLDHRLEQGKQT